LNHLWLKKPFQLLDRTAEGLFNYGTGHPLFASVLIYILVATTVFFNFYFHPDGLVWGDGYYYLSTAKAIANGELWQDGIRGAFEQMNPLWPIGYPALIGYLSKLTGLSVFWSSKTINLIALAGMIGILHKWFYPVGWIYSLCFFNAAFMEVISLTLSETVFLIGLLSFVILLERIRERPEKVIYYWLLSGILVYLCLTRYVGGFAFISTCVFAVFYWPNLKPHWRKLLLALMVSGIVVALYVCGNYLVHGHPFGERALDFRNPVQVVSSFFYSGIMLTNFPVNLSFYDLEWILIIFFLQAIILIYFLRYTRSKGSFPLKNSFYFKVSKISLVVLTVYLLFLFIAITIRSTGDFFNSRLLIPAFFLGFIFLLGFFKYDFISKKFKPFTKGLAIIALGSLFLNLPIKLVYRYVIIDQPLLTYTSKMQVIESKYREVPRKSGVVINGSQHLSYTMNNLRPIEASSLYEENNKLKVKYLRALVAKHKHVLLNIIPKHSLKAIFERHGFLLELKSNKGLLNLYEIKQSN
jgi:hypothetical protein